MSRTILPEIIDEAEELGRALLAELLDDGLQADEALELLAALGDAALPLRLLLPPPWGELTEQRDGDAILALLRRIEQELKRDPSKIERRAERAAERGHFAVAARRRARAARVRTRQASEAP